MAHIVEEVKPCRWEDKEAFSSGKMAYRIKVELRDNPFKGSLGTCWTEGWNAASAADTTSMRRVDYSAEDRYDSRRPKPRGRAPFSRDDRR